MMYGWSGLVPIAQIETRVVDRRCITNSSWENVSSGTQSNAESFLERQVATNTGELVQSHAWGIRDSE
jgi:hypothetical protein